MKTWKAHWDRQLYKALEHQYQMGLEALNENLPEIKVELTFAWVLLESHVTKNVSKRWLLDADIIQYCTASFSSWLSAYCLIPDCTDWLCHSWTLSQLLNVQGLCCAYLHKWTLITPELCERGKPQTISLIVNSCPNTRFDSDFQRLYQADEGAVIDTGWIPPRQKRS